MKWKVLKVDLIRAFYLPSFGFSVVGCMEEPQILILDEPMNGLDHQGVEEIRALLLEMKKKGTLILLASHNQEDISCLCDEVYEMDGGVLKLKKK
jgi:ABC-2 type transport system ATP-binding protein